MLFRKLGLLLVSLTLISASSAFAMNGAGMTFFVDGNGSMGFTSVDDGVGGTVKSSPGFGAGAGMILPLGNRIGLAVEGQYTTFAVTDSTTSVSASSNGVVIPVSLTYALGGGVHLLAGGYYDIGVGTLASGTSDDGVQGGIRWNVSNGMIFVDGRYYDSLKAGNNAYALAEVGVSFR